MQIASEATGATPVALTADADEDLQATLQHVVMTYDPINGRQIYVNGTFTDDIDTAVGGTLADWEKLWVDFWGPRLEHILRNAVLALSSSRADGQCSISHRRYRRHHRQLRLRCLREVVREKRREHSILRLCRTTRCA